MLAFPEILKSLTPIKKSLNKESSFRKHFLAKITDLLAIVISIYLALSIEGWAEKRNEHKRMLQYYENLISEIKKDTVSLVSVIADAKKHVSNSEKHLALLAHYTPELQDSVTRYLGKMMASQLFYSSDMITFKSLQTSGEIKLIDKLAVRDSLIKLDETYNTIKIYEDMYLKFIQNDLMGLIGSNFDLIENKLINKNCYRELGYRNHVALFRGINETRLAQYYSALPKARGTLKLIEQELAENK